MPLDPSQSVGLTQDNPSPYYSPEIAREKSIIRYMEDTSKDHDYNESPVPQRDWYSKALDTGVKTAELQNQSALNQIKNAQNSLPTYTASGQLAGGDGSESPSMEAILRALAGKESGGNYSAVNPHSGALGKYQVMPANLQGSGTGWDYDALGRDVSTQEFLQNKQIQEQIVRHRFGNYLKQHGLQGALSAWYSGDPNKWNDTSPQSTGGYSYPSINQYVMSIMRALGLA